MISLLIAFFLFALIFSFFCSLWEAVLLSITPSHARLQAQEGTRTGRYLEDFKANIDRPLAAILTLNTIAHTVGAIGVGSQAVIIWSDAHAWITGFLVPAIMTIAILVFSEIVPKTIGALYWQSLMKFTVYCLRFLIAALSPFVWLSQFITRWLKQGETQPVLTRTDFLAMAELGSEEGVFEEKESAMIGYLIRFQSIRAEDVMTPRTVVEMASEDQKIVDYYDVAKGVPFSRIPLYGESQDHITGYVRVNDLLIAMLDGKGDESLTTHSRDIVAVEASYPITDLFEELRGRQEHLAMVLDEWGGMAGIVTLEDVIETLLGLEIVDETDKEVDMRELAREHRAGRAEALNVLVEGEGHEDTTEESGGEISPIDGKSSEDSASNDSSFDGAATED